MTTIRFCLVQSSFRTSYAVVRKHLSTDMFSFFRWALFCRKCIHHRICLTLSYVTHHSTRPRTNDLHQLAPKNCLPISRAPPQSSTLHGPRRTPSERMTQMHRRSSSMTHGIQIVSSNPCHWLVRIPPPPENRKTPTKVPNSFFTHIQRTDNHCGTDCLPPQRSSSTSNADRN